MKAAKAVGKQRRPHGSIKGECISVKLCLDTAWAAVLGGSSGKHHCGDKGWCTDSRFVTAGREVIPRDWVRPLVFERLKELH